VVLLLLLMRGGWDVACALLELPATADDAVAAEDVAVPAAEEEVCPTGRDELGGSPVERQTRSVPSVMQR